MIQQDRLHFPNIDWRDPEQYKPLLALDEVGWAAEWLHRAPDFSAITRDFADNVVPSVQVPDTPRVIILRSNSAGISRGVLFRRRCKAGRYFLASFGGSRCPRCGGFSSR